MEEDDFKKLPVDERCVHKSWKARVSAYEELTKLFGQIDDEKSSEFGRYAGLIKKFVVDSNAMGQEKGLETALAFIENYALAGRTASEVMSGVVTKCMAAPKTRTRELAMQVTLAYVEIEKYEIVQEELLKGTEQKNPKIVAACINACTMILREFGSKIFSVKPLVKKIPTFFADRDKTVRDEAKQMVVEIYKWIGPVLKSQLNNVQPVQITELETEFLKVEGQKPSPVRFIRSEQQKQVTAPVSTEVVDGGKSDVDEDDEVPQMSAFDLCDPVEILSKLPKDFYEKTEAKKWQERKEAFEALDNLVHVPKLANGDYGDVVKVLKKAIEKDSNVVVVALAGKCLAGLASGLRKRFQQYSGFCVSALLEKFKEKKQNVVAAIKDAIDAIYLTTTMEAILEDVIEALGNKNPSVKAETAFFLARSLAKTQPSTINKKMLKFLTTALSKNLNESDPVVRDSSAEALGTLMKLVGEKQVSPFLVELEKDNLKMAKIKEFSDKAVITVKIVGAKKETGRPATAPAKAAAAKVVKPAATSPKLAATTVKSAGGVKKASVPIKSKRKTTVKAVEKELADEEVQVLVEPIVSATTWAALSDSNWKARLAAVEEILRNLQQKEGEEVPTQAIVKTLKQKPGLKDTNFQVLRVKLDTVKYLAEKTSFSVTSANCCLSDIIEKFGDPKNGNAASETVTAIAEATSFPFVLAETISFALNQKNPKVIQETLTWLSNSIKEFGFQNLNIKLLIENSKKALASSNPAVRQSAITLCGVMYLYMGNLLYTFFDGEKPALRDQLSAEFQKYDGMKPPIPSRGITKTESSTSLDNLDDEDAGGDAVPNIADLLPRVNIRSQITESLITELNDKNWKTRNEALTKVASIVHEAKFIKPDLGDLPQALALRLTDSNTKIAQTALNICENIAKAMGPPLKQYIKVFFPNVLQCLGDTKNWMRTTAREVVDVFAEQAGYKDFFENEMIADALKGGSPILRAEVWLWLAEVLPKVPAKVICKDELTLCIPYLYNNLEDRKADVRKNAQDAVLGFMIHLGYDSMVRHCSKLKPGSKNVIMAILDKVRPDLPVQPLPKKATEKEQKSIKGGKPVATSQNAVKPKGSAGSTKAAPVASKKKDEDVDTSPLLVINNMKHQRTIDESKLKVLKWNFITPREEFVELLKEQMAAARVNKTLIANMFHADFRYHIKAIEALMEDLSSNAPALVANLDLILKWFTLRFFDTNPSVLLKGLEYLHSAFNMLIDTKYKMLENEASSFLPYLVQKIGDPKDAVRNGVRSLFRQLCHVYSVSRLFTYIMEGVKSKNARQRAECLEALGVLIQDYGISVCVPSASVCVKDIAKQIADRDHSVRSASLNCLVQVYHIVGEKIYKMVGSIVGKDLSLLEERIRRIERSSVIPKPAMEMPSEPVDDTVIVSANITSTIKASESGDEEELPPVIISPNQVVDEPRQTKGPFCLDPEILASLDNYVPQVALRKTQVFDLSYMYEEINIPILSATDMKSKIMPLSPPKPLDLNLPVSRLNMNNQKDQISTRHDPILISYINQIASVDQQTALEGLEYVRALVPPRNAMLLHHENELMKSIVTQLRHLRNRDPQSDSMILKIYRSILSVIDVFYQNNFGRTISVENLKNIINELITILADNKLERCSNGATYMKVVNVQCVTVIEKSDHTKVTCALIQLNHQCVRVDNFAKHSDLVMKSLWRVIKLIPSWNEDLDFDAVLHDVHNFLKEFPSIWWKNKPTDTMLRTIKTVLHSCVKIKGGSIMLHLSKIPNTSESEIEPYLLKLLKSMNLEAIKPPTRISLSKASHMMLTEIFQKIGNKVETKEGLTLLYDFMQDHPEADVEPFLKKSSKFFQDYIQNGLKEIDDARKEGKRVEDVLTEKEAPSSSDTEMLTPQYWQARINMWKGILAKM